MTEAVLEQLTQRLWARLSETCSRALLLGTAPNGLQKFIYVNAKPYDAIVIGALSPAALLRMPSEPVCDALLTGMPVYFWRDQPYKHAGGPALLRADLAAAEQRLLDYGVIPLGGRLVTASDAAVLREMGERPDADSRVTPLARDILEGQDR